MNEDKGALVTSTSGGALSDVLNAEYCHACEGAKHLDDTGRVCPACEGSGRPQNPPRQLCPNCFGHGTVAQVLNEVRTGAALPCYPCRGSGLALPPEKSRNVGRGITWAGVGIGIYLGFIGVIAFGVPGLLALVPGGAVALFGLLVSTVRGERKKLTP